MSIIRDAVNRPQIEIIVLNWNNYKDTKECLSSLQILNYPCFEVVLVDNGSPDRSGEKLAKEFPEFIFLQTGKNLGYAGGNNVGIRYAIEKGADIILVLNNDVVVESADLLTQISMTMKESNKIGIVGPRIYDFVDRQRRVDRYDESIFYRWIDLVGLKLKKRVWKTQNGITLRTVDRVSGSAIAFSRDMLKKVGLFDDRFFLYAEEIDLCFRTVLAGYEIVHIDDDKVCAFHKSKVGYVPPMVWYYITRNTLHLINKQFIGLKWSLIFILHIVVVMNRASMLILNRSFKGAKYCLTGFRDGLMGKIGQKV